MRFKYDRGLQRCEIVKAMDLMVWYEDDDLDVENWLMCGPPDGVIQEYDELEDKTKSELYSLVQDSETFLGWVECFGRRVRYIKEECEWR